MIREHSLPFGSLSITVREVCEAMGYGSHPPGDEIAGMVQAQIDGAASFVVPRLAYFIIGGGMPERDTLIINGTTLHPGEIIGRQLAGSEAFAVFAATAGEEFQAWTERTALNGDVVWQFITDSLGSCIAEKAADLMEKALEEEIAPGGMKHTNRFSPGYCQWHVSEQQKLFSLFPSPAPCGIRLTSSSLMLPVKSVSGIIGIGRKVKRMEYSCGLCSMEKCYKRKRPA